MNRWSQDPNDWFEGDPIFGRTADGQLDADWQRLDPGVRREDACFATIAEVVPSRRHLYLDSFQRERCLSERGRRDIEAIMGIGRCQQD